MNPRLLGILILLAFGALKVPLEDRLTLSMRAGGLQLPPPQLGWQENFGQMMLSTLGGLRNVVASITYLQAFTAAFDDRDWGTADTLMTMTTRLQPTEPIYWDHASWFMAFNAASSSLRCSESNAFLLRLLLFILCRNFGEASGRACRPRAAASPCS